MSGVRLIGSASQDDQVTLDAILSCLSDPLDVVIDGASHMYWPSRRSFEIVFPYVRPGGAYIIEDWTWAHQGPHSAPDHPSSSRPSLANLILRLMLLHASRPDIIARIKSDPRFVLVTRGPAEIGPDFDIEGSSRNPRPMREII